MSVAGRSPEPGHEPPAADPRAIRASLPSFLVAEFDREWELVLDRAKQDMDLSPVRSMLAAWRHTAHAEAVAPGSRLRLLAKAESILATGENHDAVPVEDVRALIERRLGR